MAFDPVGHVKLRKPKRRPQAAGILSDAGKVHAVGYARVSTEEQANAYGLDMQENAIRAFAESQSYELVGMHCDAGVSGTVSPAARPGFAALLGRHASAPFSVLLTWKLDRLSRDLGDAVQTVQNLRKEMAVSYRSVTEAIDTSDGQGQFVFNLFATMAAHERHVIAQRMMSGKRAKASRGGIPGGMPPYGYAADGAGGLKLNEAEAKVVRTIFQLTKSGLPPDAVAQHLNHQQVKPRRGGEWTRSTISYMLRNLKYVGWVEFEFTDEAHGMDVLTKGQHEAIVSDMPGRRAAAAGGG